MGGSENNGRLVSKFDFIVFPPLTDLCVCVCVSGSVPTGLGRWRVARHSPLGGKIVRNLPIYRAALIAYHLVITWVEFQI